MMKRRPINLNFLTMHFPVTAWVSIAHRLSGFLVFLLIPLLLWMLQESLTSSGRFLLLKQTLQNPFMTVVIWIFLTAFFYHFLAGARHLCLDIHIGESKQGGRISAWSVIALSFIVFCLIGYWLW